MPSQSHNDATPHPRRIWDLPCVGIRVFLTHGIGQSTLRAYVEDHLCRRCNHQLEDPHVVIQLAHRACHGENPLSARLEKQFNVRFRNQVSWVRDASYFVLAKHLAAAQCSRFETLGILWALLTDTSPLKQRFGNDLLNAMVVNTPAPEPAEPYLNNVITWPHGHPHTLHPNDAPLLN